MKYLVIIKRGDVVLDRLTISAISLTSAREKTTDWAKNRFGGDISMLVRKMDRGCYTEGAIPHGAS